MLPYAISVCNLHIMQFFVSHLSSQNELRISEVEHLHPKKKLRISYTAGKTFLYSVWRFEALISVTRYVPWMICIFIII